MEELGPTLSFALRLRKIAPVTGNPRGSRGWCASRERRIKGDRMSEELSSSQAAPEHRVDSAHANVPAAAPEAAAVTFPTPDEIARSLPGEPGAVLVRQLRTQTQQISTHFREQQQRLHHREAEVYAHTACVENEIRSARLWFTLRQQELEERQQELDEKEQELDRRLAQLIQRQHGEQAANKGADGSQEEGSPQSEPGSGDAVATPQGLADREAEFRRREAQLLRDIEENSRRQARLNNDRKVLENLRKDIDAENREVRQREQQAQRREAELSAARAGLETRQAELLQQEQSLQLREAKLQARSQEIQAALSRFKQMGVVEQNAQQLQRRLAEVGQREQLLGEAEELLARQQADQRAAEQLLAMQRQQTEQQSREAFNRIAAQRAQFEAEVQQQKAALRKRREQLDSREAALGQLRGKLAHTQYETLEMRLATEELWAQLSGPLAPASLTRSLNDIRKRLAEHYRQIDADLDRRRRDLEELRSQLVEQHSRAAQQREELNAWATQQREEIEKQAQRLVQREQELDRQEQVFQQAELAWQAERQGYREEIRRLIARQREGKSTAA